MDEIIEENVAKQTAFLEGKYEGMQENQREMVINLYNKKVSLDIISECCGLTNEEVEEMINNHNQ